MRKIEKIILHCSDSDHPHHDNIEAIRRWHVNERGWIDIGYHYVITKDGSTYVGRPVETPGAHCKGHNETSIGICLTGRDVFSKEQFLSTSILIRGLQSTFSLTRFTSLYFHSELSENKTCPNFTLKQYTDGVFNYIKDQK